MSNAFCCSTVYVILSIYSLEITCFNIYNVMPRMHGGQGDHMSDNVYRAMYRGFK